MPAITPNLVGHSLIKLSNEIPAVNSSSLRYYPPSHNRSATTPHDKPATHSVLPEMHNNGLEKRSVIPEKQKDELEKHKVFLEKHKDELANRNVLTERHKDELIQLGVVFEIHKDQVEKQCVIPEKHIVKNPNHITAKKIFLIRFQ
jgi:hypothetical protein